MDSNNDNILFPIDLSIFKEHVKISFLNILENLPKTQKTLVLEQSCIKKIDFFLDFQALEERNVKRGIIILSKSALNTDSPNIVYVISPNKSCLEDILFQIQSHRKDGIERKYTVIFIPKINYDCQMFIEKNYLKAELNIQNFPIDLIPFDKDVLSLEASETIGDLFIKNDTNILSVLARAILKFETVFGKIKYKYAKGDYSRILKKIVETEEESSPFESDTEILASVMIDRSVDFITPLCSQYTYEGLIDEFIGINYNVIKVKPEILEKNEKSDIKVELSSKDKFYSKIRDLNFNHLRSYLPAKLDEHKQILAEGNKQTKDLKELSEILEKIKQVKEESPSVATHINIADFISNIIKHPFYTEYLRFEQNLLVGGDTPNLIYDFYENEMGKQSDLTKVIRVMSLESLIHNGLTAKIYDSIKRDFLNVYGYQEIFLLKNLEKLKILKKYDAKSNYDFINENLKLIKEDVNIMEPDDCSYVFGGFCPITIRLIETLVKRGWNSIKEVLRRLPGDYEYPSNEKEIINSRNKNNVILLVFVGGVTYAEIAAIRYLNNNLKDYKFVILTTHIISAKKFINDLRESFEPSMTLKEYYTQLKQLGYDANK